MTLPFSDTYIDNTVFYAWYENGKVCNSTMLEKLPEAENGKRPSSVTVQNWITTHGWIERADALDGEMSISLDNQVIQKRIEMYRRHAEVGNELIEKGMEYLVDKGITSDQAAIRAIDAGVEIQRISVGQAEVWSKIAKMSDAQLTKELYAIVGKVPDGEDDVTVQAEEVE